MHLAICNGSRSKLNGPNTMLGGTVRTTVHNVNSSPLPLFVHSLNRGHGAFATFGVAICCRKVSTRRLSVRSTPLKVFCLYHDAVDLLFALTSLRAILEPSGSHVWLGHIRSRVNHICHICTWDVFCALIGTDIAILFEQPVSAQWVLAQ